MSPPPSHSFEDQFWLYLIDPPDNHHEPPLNAAHFDSLLRAIRGCQNFITAVLNGMRYRLPRSHGSALAFDCQKW